MRFGSACVRTVARLSGILLVILWSIGCDRPIEGEFGWASTDDRGIVDPELSLLQQTEFRLGRENLYFFNYETIWWVYQINGGSYDSGEFLAALYEDNITPEPVERDLRRVLVREGDGVGLIRQFYEPLEPGRYLLKIAHNSVVVDQVRFHVVPPGGPAAMGLSEEELEDDAEEDEILLYSR